MILRLRAVRAEKKVGIAPTTGTTDKARAASSTPTLPAMRAICHFGHAEVPRFPDDVGAERGGGDVADDRHEVEDRRRGRPAALCRE